MIHSDLRKRALGDFLRRHRESVAKPAGDNRVGERRRRTSGLRREEVAEMAGISPTWYARLEQGKEATPSGAALGRIADVLRLAPAERAYLFQVARRVDPNDASNFADALVNKTIESCVLSISHPACVLDEYWTPLSWNAAWADLFAPWLKGPEKTCCAMCSLIWVQEHSSLIGSFGHVAFWRNSGSITASILKIRRCLIWSAS